MNDWLENAAKVALDAKRIEKKCAPCVNDEGYRDYQNNTTVREQTNQRKYKQISHFQAALQNISSTLRNMENEKLDCAYFQNVLEGFESKLCNFKTLMANEFEELDNTERCLSRDLDILQDHILHSMTEEAKAVGSTHSISSGQQQEVKVRNDKISAQKTEIGVIERKLTALGGRLGGWDSRDHDSFLRVWTQLAPPKKEREAATSTVGEDSAQTDILHGTARLVDRLGARVAQMMRKKLVHAVPMQSEDEIEKHLLWYVEVEALLLHKKEVLSMWKKEQDKDKPEPSAVISESSCEGCSLTSAEKRALSDKKREQNKRRVEKWQKEKDDERSRKELRDKQLKEDQERSRQRLESERRRSNRVMVQNWVNEKEAKNITTTVNPTRPKVSSASLETLRKKQDIEIDKAKSRRQKLNTTRAASTGRLQRQKQLAESIPDPPSQRPTVKSKLHEPTKVYLANRLTGEDLDAREKNRRGGGAHDSRVASGGYDLKFSGRAIPAWTRGVM